MDKDEILRIADECHVAALVISGRGEKYLLAEGDYGDTTDDVIDFANRIHAAGVREGMGRAAAMCECRTMALDHGGNEYRREAPASQCAAFIRAAAEKIGGGE